MVDRRTIVRAAADRGVATALDRFDDTLEVDTKGETMDYVTDADVAAQRAIIETIDAEYPDDAIVAEEEAALKSIPASGDAWVIDPIDGTTNFVHGLKIWGPAIAAVRDGATVAAVVKLPAYGDTYVVDDTVEKNGTEISVSERRDPATFVSAPILRYTTRDRDRFARLTDAMISELGDLRRLGCAQATLAMVADGTIDATIGPFEPFPWDTVAGAHMVEAAGGTVTDLSGNPWTPDSDGIVASNGRAHDQLIEMLTAYDLNT